MKWLIIALGILLVSGVQGLPANNASTSADNVSEEAMFRKNQHAFELWLEKSTSPRDWALASQLLVGMDGEDKSARHRAAALLQKAADAARYDRLILWLWSLQPAEDQDCKKPGECGKRAFALKLLEPGNGAALAWDVTDAWERKNVAATRSAQENGTGEPLR